ncbi:hypothetical protein [Riemerella anatipestifer]
MKNLIIDSVKNNKHNISSSDCYFLIYGALKNKENNSMSADLEKSIRAWNNFDKNETLYSIFYSTKFVKGGFLSADRVYHFTTCFTDEGIRILGTTQTDGWLKEDDAKIDIFWDEIENIKYNPSINIQDENTKPNSFFIPGDQTVSLLGLNEVLDGYYIYSKEDNSYLIVPSIYFGEDKNLSPLLNELVQKINFEREKNTEKIQEAENKVKILLKSGDENTLLTTIERVEDLIPDYLYHYAKIYAFCKKGLAEDANLYFNKLVQIESKLLTKDKTPDFLKYYHLSKAEIDCLNGSLYSSAQNFYEAKEIEASSENVDYEFIQKIDNKYQQLYQGYIDNFEQVNYNDRKIITLTKQEKLYEGEHLKVLNVNMLPQIKFPVSHPKTDTTYICHPHKTSIYLPIEDYDHELLMDRINEYFYLLQSLEATSIIIRNTKGQKKDKNIFSSSKMEGRIQTEGATKMIADVNAGGGMNHDSSRYDSEANISKFGREQFFNPTKAPFIPDDLLWFHHEPSWQRLAQQRLNGDLLEHNEFISSAKNQIISQEEINKINADLKVVIPKGGASVKYNKNNTDTAILKLNEEEEWKIYVKFKPISEFGNKEIGADSYSETKLISNVTLNEHLDENEEKYMEEVKFIIEHDGVIGDRDRRILERFRVRFGISEEKAAELEHRVLNQVDYQFTEEEKEYIEEYKSLISDSKEIDDKTRRLLNRLAQLLGIDEDRASELESL